MMVSQFKKRFKKSHMPKYGSLNKGFDEREIAAFFRVVDNPKFHLLFSYRAQLGLRIGEVVRTNIKDVKLESRELVVRTEKAMTLDALLIPAPLFKETLDYIETNSGSIGEGAGLPFLQGKGQEQDSRAVSGSELRTQRF